MGVGRRKDVYLKGGDLFWNKRRCRKQYIDITAAYRVKKRCQSCRKCVGFICEFVIFWQFFDFMARGFYKRSDAYFRAATIASWITRLQVHFLAGISFLANPFLLLGAILAAEMGLLGKNTVCYEGKMNNAWCLKKKIKKIILVKKNTFSRTAHQVENKQLLREEIWCWNRVR